ncbi:DUF1016 N-terminal domain-containing protein [Phyllobacterium sp. KW56]|nr:DUF1016 N-terminal domain-containing protein [Phyllobacterium sp. KW56]
MGVRVIDRPGLLPRNLKYMRAFAQVFPDEEIVQQLAARLPWGQNVKRIEALKSTEEQLWYVRHAEKHGWSRNLLAYQVESGLYRRQGKVLTTSHGPSLLHSLPWRSKAFCED